MAIRSFLKRLDMIKLKSEVNKREIMRQLRTEAEIAFENTWQKDMQIRAYMNGAHDLLKKLRIAHVIGSVPLHVCKYCGVETNEPDEQCYKAP